MSATDAARGFAELLDQVEASGESVVIERRGKAVATIGPAIVTTWHDVQGALAELPQAPPDDGWLEELQELRRFIGPVQDRWSE